MRKFIFLGLTAFILLSASSAFAINENASPRGLENSEHGLQIAEENKSRAGKPEGVLGSNQSSNGNADNTNNNEEENENVVLAQNQENGVVNVDEECDPEAEWKNHGQYVSCVAKLNLGGEIVAQAAQSDIGKKADSDNQEDATPSATPTPVDEEENGEENNEEENTEENTEETESEEENEEELEGLIEQLQALIEELRNLINSLTPSL